MEESRYNNAIKYSGGRKDEALDEARNLLAAQSMVQSMSVYNSYPQNPYTQQQQVGGVIPYTGQKANYQSPISYDADLKPNINEEATRASQESLRAFYNNNGWDEYNDDTVREELTRNLTMLQNVSAAVNYTDAMFSKQYYSGFIPFYITNVAESMQFVDINFENQKLKTIAIPEDAFKSTTDYAQPVITGGGFLGGNSGMKTMIPTVSTPTGNTQNCLMVSVNLYDIVNTTDYPVAIVLGQRETGKSRGGGSGFKPWGKRRYYVNRNLFPSNSLELTDSRVHWVIPPRFNKQNDHVTIYKSGYEVNLPIGARYPSVDGKKETLMDNTEKTITNSVITKHTVSANHPIVEWLFANVPYYGNKLQPPQEVSGVIAEDGIKKYEIQAQTYSLACDLFLRDFNLAVPIVNLSAMEIHAFLLIPADNTSYSSKLAKDSELDFKLKNAQYGRDNVIQTLLKETNTYGSVFFRMGTDHIFRDELVSPSPAEKREI